MTWSSRANPVKMQLNPKRGHGVTVLGAIGHMLKKPVFTLAKSTCRQSVVEFLKKLNTVINPDHLVPKKKVTIVLDNHLAHKTNEVIELAR